MKQSKLDFKAKKDPFIQSLKNLSDDTYDQKLSAEKTKEKDLAIEILRSFDLDSKYGPCIGISRLERFNRALALGLDPDPRILEYLKTFSDPDITECIWDHLK